MSRTKTPRLDLALDEALATIGNLIDLLDVEGAGQTDPGLTAARTFHDRFLRFVRYRKCCANCAHFRERGARRSCVFRPDEELLLGKADDPGLYGLACDYYNCKYEDPLQKGRP